MREQRLTRAVTRVRPTLADDGFVLVAVVVQSVGNLAFHALSARIVGASAYGALATLLTLSVALTIPLAALQTGVTRSVAEARESADPRPLLRRARGWSAALAVLLVITTPLVDGLLGLGSATAAMLLAPYVATATLAAVTRGIAVGRSRQGVAAKSILAAALTRLAAGLVLTAWLGLVGAMLATCLAEAVGVAVAWPARSSGAFASLQIAWTSLADTLAVTIGVWLMGSADVLAAGHYLEGRERSVYLAAGTSARAILILPQAAAMVAMRRFVHAVRDHEAGPVPHGPTATWRSLRDSMLLAFVLTSAGVAAVSLGGSRVLTVAFGPAFAGAAGVLRLCALATIPVALASVLATYHLAGHSRLALAPWVGVLTEFATIGIWHDSAEQLAWAALGGVGIQLLLAVPLIVRERHRDLREIRVEADEPPRGDGLVQRVLILAWRDLAHPAAGGSELYVERIARQWVAAGHSVTLCCARVPRRPAHEIVHGVEIVRRGNRFTVYRHARRFVESQRRFDVILECVNTKPFDAPRVAGSTPVVALIHQLAREVWWYEAPFPAAILGRFVLEPRWLRRYRHIPTLTISESSRESLAEHGIVDITIVPVGIDSPDRAVVRSKDEVPTLVFCGRLVRSKRPAHAIKAFRQLRARFPDLRLVLIGGGPQRARLARHSGVGVEFTGHVSAAEKQRIVASAHALVVTSVREGWGLVVSEAAALGTPAVGYNVAGLRDSIAAGRGVTCKPCPGALAAALGASLGAWIKEPPAALPFGGATSWEETADAVLAALVKTTNGCRADRLPPRPARVIARSTTEAEGELEGLEGLEGLVA